MKLVFIIIIIGISLCITGCNSVQRIKIDTVHNNLECPKPITPIYNGVSTDYTDHENIYRLVQDLNTAIQYSKSLEDTVLCYEQQQKRK